MASKVDPRVLWKTPGKQPNGLQATREGLWVIDQIDPNDIYLLSYEGKELKKIPTRAKHSSGIAIDPKGNIWVGSTFTLRLPARPPDAALPLPVSVEIEPQSAV